MMFFVAALADPPYTPCHLEGSVPNAGAVDVPFDLDLRLFISGEACGAIDGYRILHGGTVVEEQGFEPYPRLGFGVGFDAWTPGLWEVELLGPDQPLTTSFEVVDAMGTVPATPTVGGATVRSADDPHDVVLDLQVTLHEGTEMVAFESAGGVRYQHLPGDAWDLRFDRRSEGDTLCVDVAARGYSATWSEPTEVCLDVPPPPPRQDVAPDEPSERGGTGCATTASPGAWRLLRR